MADNPILNLTASTDVAARNVSDARKAHPDVPFHADFRRMLDRHGKSIDGGVISTPDHTHHYNAKWCLNAGKPVYLEKPLTHSIAEARDLLAEGYFV